MIPASPQTTAWPVRPLRARPAELPMPPAKGTDWLPLRQNWLPAVEPFRPGWARIFWSPQELVFEWLFLGAPAGNRARRLNEPTWELGDVGEVFVQIEGRTDYGEFHVTPENQRLQLWWPPGGLARLRAGTAPLEHFTMGADAGLASTTAVHTDHWAARVSIPVRVLGVASLGPESRLRAAVCRYDCGAGPTEVNSSSAPLSELAFHRPNEWNRLTLSPA
jgi:hypothetical protein